jgi:hypothetical protein
MDWGADPLEISFLIYNNIGTEFQILKRPSITASIVRGNGEIKAGLGCGSSLASYTTDPIEINAFNNYEDEPPDLCKPMSNLWKLLYKRDNEVTDESPIIHLVYGDEPSITLDFGIILYDAGGDPM